MSEAPCIVLHFADADECPAVAAFWLTLPSEMAGHFASRRSTFEYRYTEDMELAKRWIDKGGQARLVKAWRLPNGHYALREPKSTAVCAVAPYRGIA